MFIVYQKSIRKRLKYALLIVREAISILFISSNFKRQKYTIAKERILLRIVKKVFIKECTMINWSIKIQKIS